MGENDKRILKAVGSSQLEAMTGSGWVLVDTHRESVLLDPVTGETVEGQNAWNRREQYRAFDHRSIPTAVLAERVIFVVGRSENDQLALLTEQVQAAHRMSADERQKCYALETENAKLVKKIAELETKLFEKEEQSTGWKKDVETKRGQIAALEKSLSTIRTVIGKKAYDDALSTDEKKGQPYR